MRGISEKKLREWKRKSEQLGLNGTKSDELLNLIIRDCEELNYLKPIDDDTPTDRQILLYCPKPHTGVIQNEFVAEKLSVFVKTFYKSTHWTELPPLPNE